MKLNRQHELFCREYLRDMNAEMAARRAGYAEKSAARTAWRLLRTEEIRQRLRELKNEPSAGSRVATHSEVLEFFTDVMRREADNEVKLSDAMNAADKLHKYFQQKTAEEKDEKETGIVILPEVN